jgi:hypothetical protein
MPEIIPRLPARVDLGALVYLNSVDAREHSPAQPSIFGFVARNALSDNRGRVVPQRALLVNITY